MAGDYSSSNRTISWANIQTQGGEKVFNGSNANGSVPDHADWELAGDFTIELFGVKWASKSSSMALLSHYIASGNQRGWIVFFTTAPDIQFHFSTAGTSASTSVVSADFDPVLNQAYDVTIERASGDLRIYVDGAMLKKEALAGTSFNSTSDLKIGSLGDNSSHFNGRMKASRITKGVARYASDGGYTVPTLPLPTA